jgi:hypothetical protein
VNVGEEGEIGLEIRGEAFRTGIGNGKKTRRMHVHRAYIEEPKTAQIVLNHPKTQIA